MRISVIVHATEDASRIAESLSLLGAAPDSLETVQSEGHYRNVITTISASLYRNEARRALKAFGAALSDADAARIRETLPSRTDGSALYVRLDKQEMVSGRVRLDDSGAVRIRIMSPRHDRDGALRLLDLD